MVRTTLATVDAKCRVQLVHARVGKRARAEPISALYEQGKVIHCGDFLALEEQLMSITPAMDEAEDLDRADALVWALTELMLNGRATPRVLLA
jgi:phage terminase large subunit-like protein